MGTNKQTMRIDREDVLDLLMKHRPSRSIKELRTLNSKILIEMLASDYKLLSEELTEQLRIAKNVV